MMKIWSHVNQKLEKQWDFYDLKQEMAVLQHIRYLPYLEGRKQVPIAFHYSKFMLRFKNNN